MDDAQSEALGPRKERTLEKPSLDAKTRTLVGGAAIERSPRNWDPARAHTIGPTREIQRNIIAPPASGKLKSIGAKLDENLQTRKKVIKVRQILTPRVHWNLIFPSHSGRGSDHIPGFEHRSTSNGGEYSNVFRHQQPPASGLS